MDTLQKAREEITALDREIAALFEKRMGAVAKVATYKKEHGLPILDPTREEAVVQMASSAVKDPEIRGYYTEYLRQTMKISRAYQSRLNEGLRVAYCGVSGAFAAIAAEKIFPSSVYVPTADFRAAYDGVVAGECDCAVLPIENSTAGEVGQVMDMLFSGPLFVNGIYDLTVNHCLVGVKGANEESVREVISHPQALEQCAPYLSKNGWRQVRFENTAMAAKEVAEKNDPAVAAIASEETAALYGLQVIARNVHSSGMNTTRFAVLSRYAAKPDFTSPSERHSLLVFTVRHEAGALAKVVGKIGEYGYNMRCLRSRPLKELAWRYYFYVEIEGDLSSDAGRAMIEEILPLCDKCRLLGTFRFPATL